MCLEVRLGIVTTVLLYVLVLSRLIEFPFAMDFSRDQDLALLDFTSEACYVWCLLTFCQEFDQLRRYVALGDVHGRLRDDAACGFDDTSLSRLALAPRVVREVILKVPFFRHATIGSRALLSLFVECCMANHRSTSWARFAT